MTQKFCYLYLFPAVSQFVTLPQVAHELHKFYQSSSCISSAITFENHLCFLTSQ